MEKSRIKFTKHGQRLLKFILPILVLSFNFSTFARTPSWDELRRLSFVQGSDYFFTESDCPFYLDVYDVRPENVQVAVNYLPENVSFVSSKKEVLMSSSSNGQYASGTRLIVYFKFSKAGRYHLRPIDVVINGGFYRLSFQSVQVFENPKFILPKLSIQFENEKFTPTRRNPNHFSATAGEHIIFTVYVQYAVRVDNFAWTIPENSLFKQIKQFDSLSKINSSQAEFSPELYPVVSFDWQPLTSGKFELPSIYLQATAYNGSRYDLENSSYTFDVKSPASSAKTAQKSSNLTAENSENSENQTEIFSYAFEKPYEEELSQNKLSSSQEDLYELLELRQKEKRSLPKISKAAKMRVEKENQLGLNSENSEASIPIFWIFVSISIILLIAFVILFIFKRNQLGAVCALLFAIMAASSIIYGSKLTKTYVIYMGGSLSPIPEQNVSSGVNLQSGSLALLVQKAGDWVYIKHNETYGWVLKDNVLIIK